jgi:site-specific DNA recombinase
LLVAIYARVSTEEQAQEGFSIAAQQDKMFAFCKAQGWAVADAYVDEGVSGARLDRPQLHRLRQDARDRKFELVLVWKVDRLSRKVAHLAYLIEEFDALGIAFRSVTEPFDTTHAAGRAFLHMLGVFAELERENIKERSKIGIRKRVQEGYVHGRPVPLGYTHVDRGKWEIDPEGAAIVKWIFDQYLSGVGAFRLAEMLKAGGIPGLSDYRLKAEFSGPRPESVADRIRWILRNPVYAGYAPLNGELFPGRHEAIVTPDVWRKACMLMDSRARLPNRAHTSEYILTGRIFCGKCGAAMFGKRDANKYKTSDARPFYEYYICPNSAQTRGKHKSCDAGSISRDLVEERVLAAIREMTLHPPFEISTHDPVLEALQNRRRIITTSLSRIAKRRQKWFQAFEEAPDVESAALARIRELAEEERSLMKELGSVEAQIREMGPPLAREQVSGYLSNVASSLEHADPHQKREIIRTLVRRVIVIPTEQRRKGNIVKDVRVEFFPL